MNPNRKKFVLWFLACGFVLNFASKFLLDQPRESLWASPGQADWQRLVSTILSPIEIVLFGPVVWLQQDPDPPPPFRLILCAVYWTLLAMGIHYLLQRRKAALRS